MTKWIEGIEHPVVWAVMVEVNGRLQICKAGTHSMIYVNQATARVQMKRLVNQGLDESYLKLVRYTADSEILNWRN